MTLRNDDSHPSANLLHGVLDPGEKRTLREGPNVVALGGGHGLAGTLQAARQYAGEIAGIVSLGDDGGSSGLLRSDYPVPPPGDVRRCISALAADGSLLGQSLEYRHSDGMLKGHPVGNLLLTSLAMTTGDFATAVEEVLRLVDAVGTVYPATTVPVTLVADADEGTIASQVAIDQATGVKNLRYQPPNPPVPAEAIAAILNADQVILGPGSFYTSVLAAASVPAVRRALRSTSAIRILVANIADTKPGDPLVDIADHVDALAEHDLKIDIVLVDKAADTSGVDGPDVVQGSLASDNGWTHDISQLAGSLAKISRSHR